MDMKPKNRVKKEEITRRLERMRQPLGDWGLPPEAIDLLIEIETESPEPHGDLPDAPSSHAA